MQVHKYNSEQIPKPIEIGHNLFKIVVPQPFYTPNNIYVLTGKEPALVDGGFIQSLGILQRGLKHLGLSLSKIKHIFYTHNHLDHISTAITMRYYSDAALYGMKGMSDSMGNYMKYISDFQRTMDRLVYKATLDLDERKVELQSSQDGWVKFFNAYKTAKKLEPKINMDVELVSGDVVDIGDREIGFIHTPGHNQWHLTPYILGEGIYFTGDLILENISAVYAEVDGNLKDYVQSLDRLLKLPIKRILPAHGEEPEDPKRTIKLLGKTINLLERGVIRRLKIGEYDLRSLVLEAMGEKVKKGSYYIVALALIHSIILKLISMGAVEILEIDPPYEKYRWIGND